MKSQRAKRYIDHLSIDKVVVGALTIITLLSGSIAASVHVNADGETAVVDEVTVIIPAACSLSGTITSGEEHTETITPGNYVDDIGTTDLKAICNDFNGFSIYAVGYSNDTESTTSMIGASSGAVIATGTAEEGNTSQWAMKLTAITDSSITYNPSNLSIVGGFNVYSSVPSSLTKVVEYKDSNSSNSSTTDQTKGAHIETTYAAYIAATQAADTYTGKVRYLLVHPANFTTGTYSIVYNANGGTNTMSTETSIPNYEPHTIPTSTITPPSGYVLAGWCTVQDSTATAQNPQTICDGTSYADQGTIPASTVAASGSITLYAYWKLPPTV